VATALPALFAIDTVVLKNPVRQVAELRPSHSVAPVSFTNGKTKGLLFSASGEDPEVLAVPFRTKDVLNGHERVVEGDVRDAASLVKGRWMRHPVFLSAPTSADCERAQVDTLASWVNAFAYVAEDRANGVFGLRTPQVGALHRVHAHWAVTNDVGTIVMPTGTGKTDTMIAVLLSVRCQRLLVVVPSDALRQQTADKFTTLGVLRHPDSELLTAGAKHPVVATLLHVPKDVAEVDEVFGRAQVIVMTSQTAGRCTEDVQKRIAALCPYVFFDEAHHSEARTWQEFRGRLSASRVLQFTATPFREDGRLLDGEIIFKYPLRKAQQEEYFKPITFKPVREFNRKRADQAIAEAAVQQLRADAEKGHILMARVDTTARAREVFPIYQQYAEFNPVELHTGISAAQAKQTRKLIGAKETKIIVCVNMLGEGFDLPELKIAAFHDIRKSLAVTLQLAGRFTRHRTDLGDATFIANTADVDVGRELKKLYSRDPDWNALLPMLSDAMIGEQQDLQAFLKGFTDFADEIPLKTVRPSMSMVAYKTRCKDWTPDSFEDGIFNASQCERIVHTLNPERHTLVIVTARREALDWSDVEALHGWVWDLYVAIWSPEQNLLFINCSANTGEYKTLAKALCGENVELIEGDDVFKSFAGIKRVRLQNVGLSERLGRRIRYTGMMGPDVEDGVPAAQRERSTRSVLAGAGFEGGELTTIGASKKGRIWSHQRDTVDKLASWCKQVGAKLLDPGISPDQVLDGTLKPRTVSVRPPTMPIAVDWPEETYLSQERIWSFEIGGETVGITNVSIEVNSPTLAGPLRFALVTEQSSAVFELVLFETDGVKDYRIEQQSAGQVFVNHGRQRVSAAHFFTKEPPTFWFADGAALEGSTHVPLRFTRPPYPAEKIEVWDWSGVNLKQESQKLEKRPESIQARVIQRLLQTGEYAIVFDDDASGEAADVVAIKLIGSIAEPKALEVEFYHCKFSLEEKPGARIDDLYQVCGQAQKSIHWMRTPETKTDLLTHLLRRDSERREQDGATRFELGDSDLLHTMKEISEMCPMSLSITVVQPGVSKADVSFDQLQLLAVTENHLFERADIPFKVVASASANG
jgi:superfamily II DNA or RNA helicase